MNAANTPEPRHSHAGQPSPFVALMRRYCNDYTNRHDMTVCDAIMEPGYTLNMGTHRLAGRDTQYKPATLRQLTQFPGLCLTVNQIVTNGDRLVMRFSEHGASCRHEGRHASWNGIGLYRWNGTRLVENFVEQDYYARRLQLQSGLAAPVESPAVAPWDTVPLPANPHNEALVRAALEKEALLAGHDTLLDSAALLFDDEWIGGARTDKILDPEEVTINDMFSAGDHVALHIAVRGRIRRDSHFAAGNGPVPALLHMAILLQMSEGRVVWGRGVRDRIGLMRRLDQTAS